MGSRSRRVWVIEILSPRDTFRSYFAGRDGTGELLWVEDPAEAMHFAERGNAAETGATLGLHGHERVVPYQRGRRPSRRAAPALGRAA